MNHADQFSFILKPSTIPDAGIGVFAVHPINEGVRLKFHPDQFEFQRLKRDAIPEAFLMYCIAEEDDWYRCPLFFNRMEIGWYLNHSHAPNVMRKEDGLYSSCFINTGDELCIDYNILNEPLEKKEEYYLIK
jgi:hypothetical protein